MNGIIAGVQVIERAFEGVIILKNGLTLDVLNLEPSLWVESKFSMVKVCVVVGMASLREVLKK